MRAWSICIENGLVTCLDAKTGEQYYKERLLSTSIARRPVIADGKLYITAAKGRYSSWPRQRAESSGGK